MWLTSQIRCTPRLDEEEYGGHQLLLMEGLMPGIAVFLVRPHTLCSQFALLFSSMSETLHQLILSCGPASHYKYVFESFGRAQCGRSECMCVGYCAAQLDHRIQCHARISVCDSARLMPPLVGMCMRVFTACECSQHVNILE